MFTPTELDAARALPRGHHPTDDQHDDRPYDGADEARAFVRTIPAHGLTEPCRDERADDAEDGGEDETGGLVASRHDELRDHARDKADDDGPEDAHVDLRSVGAGRYRAKSASVGSRPCGVYRSTALGNSRESRASSSSRDSPVCCDSVAKTSGPIACSSCGAASCLLGPVPTQESAASPCPFCLKRSISSPRPPLRNPPAPTPPSVLPNWLSTPPSPPCPGAVAP